MSIERPGTGARFDEAIDGAVREMVQVDPPAGMRPRVLARIEAPARPFLTVPRLVAAAGLAVAIVIGVVVTRQPEPAPGPSQVVERAPAPVPDAPSPSLGPPDTPARDVRRAGDRRVRPVVDVNPPTSEFKPTIALAALEPIDPIVVAPLEPPLVASDDIVIEPLAPLAELEIAPLFPSDGRD